MTTLRTHVRTALLVLVTAGVHAACGEAVAPNTDDPALATGPGGGAEIRWEIPLIGVNPSVPEAKGKAKFRDKGGEQELEIQVENLHQCAGGPPPPPPPPLSLNRVPVDAGCLVEFFVDGLSVGTSTVDAIGDARINLNTDEGESVPSVHLGSVVIATLGGVPVVQGTF